MLKAYLAPEGYKEILLKEIGKKPIEVFDRLVLVENLGFEPLWAENIWYDPIQIKIDSIKDGAKKLKAIQRNWACYSHIMHRRCALITEELPYVSAKPVNFPSPLPKSPIGNWCLIDKDTILAAGETSSLFPNGALKFNEDKKAPPNRAYLKLWEALTLAQKMPGKNDVAIDLGSSPGGWTWVLASLGAKVISVDKAPLDKKISIMPNVIFEKNSAFALSPKNYKDVNWIFSDIACYPERLLSLVNQWLKEKPDANFICTLKFQGEADYNISKEFMKIKGSKIMHLHHNKHELTWIRVNI